MLRQLKNINKTHLFRTGLFIISVMLIVYVLPRERKFRYEFQEAKPWMHEDLYAPFDFPIYKSEKDISAEKDTLLKSLHPYYKRDSSVSNENLKEFTKYFKSKWEDYIANKHTTISSHQLNDYREAAFNKAYNLLESAYKIGIIEMIDELLRNAENDHYYLVYVKSQQNKAYELKEAFSEKQAYQYILEGIQQEDRSDISPNKFTKKFLQKIRFNQFIQPNLTYDAKTTQKVKKEILGDISPTEGLVQANEIIISKGEIVTESKYKILSSLQKEYQQRVGGQENIILLGQTIFIALSLLFLFLFINNFRHDILKNNLSMTFIVSLVVVFVALGAGLLQWLKINPGADWNLYVIPFALSPIIIHTFYDSRLALFVHIITILIVGFIAPNGFEFVFLNFSAGIVAIYSLSNQYRRGRLFFTSATVILTYCLVYFSIAIIQEGKLQNIDWTYFLWFFANGILLLTSYLLIYVFEKLFGFLSDATLVELSDTNQPLLRKLAEIAPGTFQHSLQVANLAEEAIRQIGGNTLLVRTGALYHDIGKMENPAYFIENQDSSYNPHNQIELDESAKIIINHVIKGVEMAKKNKLPSQIIAFIKSHHGTSTVQYFYKNYLNKYPERHLDINHFQYPGPKPASKETAVVMMADSVEAASRSLKQMTDKSITELVDGIIAYQIENEQYTDADITFRDVDIIKGILKTKLKNIYHGRIEYPS